MVGCPENYSPSANFHRKTVWENIESRFWDSFRIDKQLVNDDNFYKTHEEFFNKLSTSISINTRKNLEELGIVGEEKIQRITWSTVSIMWEQWKWFFTWSWGFIAPNVVATTAHVLRDAKNGELVLSTYRIISGDGKIFKPKAFYIDRICDDDIAFILTDRSSDHSFDIWWREANSDSDTLTLWMPFWIPNFQLESNVWVTGKITSWFINFSQWLYQTDADNDGRPDIDEYSITDNPIRPWHSWWIVVDPESLWLKWLVARWSWPEFISGWLYEPISKIRPRFVDFVKSMTQFGFEVEKH